MKGTLHRFRKLMLNQVNVLMYPGTFILNFYDAIRLPLWLRMDSLLYNRMKKRGDVKTINQEAEGGGGGGSNKASDRETMFSQLAKRSARQRF